MMTWSFEKSTSGPGKSFIHSITLYDKSLSIKNCGACCKLGPLDSRPDLSTYLSPEELDTYKSLIGPDDWCINFDQTNRLCKIYDTRPNFCRVDGEKYEKMYDIKADELSVSDLTVDLSISIISYLIRIFADFVVQNISEMYMEKIRMKWSDSRMYSPVLIKIPK